MSSNYSVSTSESGSFCTNPAPHHTHPRNDVPNTAEAAKRSRNADAAAESTTRNDATPKKASQSTRVAAAASKESPSMTIRRVPVDYSKRMEDQMARSSALERYKMLVKANRLVPSEGEATPTPSKLQGASSVGAADEGDDDDANAMSTTWRRSDQLPSYVHREGSAVSQTVLSDVSDDENDRGDEAAAAAADAGRVSQGRTSADPRPPRSRSRGQRQDLRRLPEEDEEGQRARSSVSDVSVSVSVDRPAYTAPSATKPQRGVTEVPALHLRNAQQQQQQQPVSEVKPLPAKETKSSATPGGVGKEADDAAATTDYVSPELTQPFGSGSSNLKPRNSLRPGYEPVTEHKGGASFTRTSSFSTDGQQQLTPRRQQQQQPQSATSQVRTRSSAAQSRQGVAATGPSTPRRTSTAKARAVDAPVEESVPARAIHVDPTPVPEEETEKAAGGDNAADDEAQHCHQRSEDGVVPLPGSKTAFWLRPSTAMYEMTTSIAAKRKDHSETESSTRTSSRRASHAQRHGTTAGGGSAMNSPCGTPRGHHEEARPRFSTHVSAADRKVYEEGGAAVSVPPSSTTYDAIFHNRQSVTQRSSTRRSQKAPAAAATTATSSIASSTPRGTPRGTSQRRAAPRVGELVRSPSALSRLSSNPPRPTAAADGSEAETGRVSTRQQDAMSKHCARVAAGETARAEEAAAKSLRPTAAATGAEAKAKKAKRTPSAAAATTTTITAAGINTRAGAAVEAPRKRTAAQPAAEAVHKKLVYETAEEDEGDGPVPQTVVPQSSKRHVVPAPAEAREEEEEALAASPPTTIHGRRSGGEVTPSKSQRREHDTTASPPRDDADANATTAAAEARFAAQEAEMAREKEAARARQAREALESCRLARQARVEAARTTHGVGAAAAVSTNEVVAAMLQGIVQQTRQVLPCFLCAELQCTSGYRVHVGTCRPATEGVLRDYYTTVAGLDDIPAEVRERVERVAGMEVPLSSADVAVRDAFAKECYQCVKSMMVPCRKCGTKLRVQDVKEHEMLCGRAYYQNSRAAERVRSAADRIERGAQDK